MWAFVPLSDRTFFLRLARSGAGLVARLIAPHSITFLIITPYKIEGQLVALFSVNNTYRFIYGILRTITTHQLNQQDYNW